MSGTGWKNPFSLLAPKRRKASVESSGRQSPFSMAGAGSSPSTSTEGETLDTRIQSAIQYAVSYDTGSQSSKGSRAGKSMSKNASMDSAVMDKSRSMDAATEGKNRSWDSARSATFPFNQAGSLHQAAGGTRPCNISRESSATSASSNAPHTPRHLLSVPTTPIGGAPEPFHRASSAGSQSSLNFSAFLRVGSDPTTRSVHSNIGRTSSMFSHTSSVGSNRARRVAAGEVDSPTRADEPPAKPPKPVPCEDEQSTQAWEGWHSTVPNGILCPLSLEIMSDPVFTCDGETPCTPKKDLNTACSTNIPLCASCVQARVQTACV